MSIFYVIISLQQSYKSNNYFIFKILKLFYLISIIQKYIKKILQKDIIVLIYFKIV